jgi:phage terminase large subunit-like protein
MGDNSDKALRELDRLPEDARLAALDVLIEKRRKKCYIKYFEPWSEQRDALRKFTKDIKIFGLLGGNRSGKTILGAFIAVAWCLGKDYFKGEPVWDIIKDLPIPAGPVNVWVVGLDYGVLRDVIWYEKLRHGKSHPPFLPTDASVKKVSDGDFQVFFANGSLLTGKSADAGREKFQGASIDLVWLDEECDESIFDECYQRTVDCGGKLLLTLTPLTDINSGVRTPWVFDLYEEARAKSGGDVVFCQLSTINSPFVPQVEKEKLLERWAGDPEEGARLYGDFVRRSGLVYPDWNRDIHIVKPFSIPLHWQRIVSIDPAATGVTAAIWIAVDDKGNYWGYREYYEREKIVSEHAKGIKMLCMGEPVDIWLLDPKWGSQRNAETHKTGEQLWREAGIPVRLPKVGEDYGLHVSREYVNATITPNARHPQFHITTDLPNFAFEISHYTYDSFSKGENKGLSKDKPRKRHDHLMNAWQYASTLGLKGKTQPKRNSGGFFSKENEFGEMKTERVNNSSYT